MTGAGPGSVGTPGRGRSLYVYAAMALFIAGSSAPIPLLPLYGELLDLPPDRVALLFGSYLATMVLSLGLSSIPAAQAKPRLTLSIALVGSLVSDVFFLAGTEPALLTGRILTGFSVGFGLGAGATLAMLLRGEHGRSIAATMTMVAGFTGILGSALLADLTPWPTTAPFVVHGVATILVLVLVSLSTMPTALAPTIRSERRPHSDIVPPELTGTDIQRGAAVPPEPNVRPSRTAVVASVAVGILAWSIGNAVVGLAPTIVRDSLRSDSLLVASLVAVLVAGFGIAGQYSMPLSRSRLSVTVAALCLTAGTLCVAVGISIGQVPIILAGGALTGAGQGAGYRLGMLASTRGLPPQMHGARTSLYAGVAYVSAAASVQIGGALMTGFGQAGLQLFLAVFLVPVTYLLAMCFFGQWRPVAPA